MSQAKRKWLTVGVIAIIIVAVFVAAFAVYIYPALFPPPEKELIPVTMVSSTPTATPSAIWGYAAKDWGYFEEEGLDVTVESVSGGSLAVKAVLAGEADFGMIGVTETIIGSVESEMFKVILGGPCKTAYYLVAKEEIATMKDLEGHTFGISGYGAMSHLLAVAMMRETGVDSEKVELVIIGGESTRGQALISGKIDAALVGILTGRLIIEEAPLHILAEFTEICPFFYNQFAVASNRIMNDNPEVAVAFCKAMIRALRTCISNETAYIWACQQRMEVSEEDLHTTWEYYTETDSWDPNGGLDLDRLELHIGKMVEYGVMDKFYAVSQWATFEFQEKALEQLPTWEA